MRGDCHVNQRVRGEVDQRVDAGAARSQQLLVRSE
jgi:hypothetical protein